MYICYRYIYIYIYYRIQLNRLEQLLELCSSDTRGENRQTLLYQQFIGGKTCPCA